MICLNVRLERCPARRRLRARLWGRSLPENSKIELILQDCVVQENCKSLSSRYAGQSYNIYNATLKRWEQYWVDNVGGNVLFYGGLKDGVMDYWTDDVL